MGNDKEIKFIDILGEALPYIFFVTVLLPSLHSVSHREQDEKFSRLEEALTPNTTNVIGQDPNDVFYEINGQRAYLEVDGQPIEKYLEKN